MRFKECDVVEVRKDWPEQGLKIGDRGTVVMVHSNPDGYEIEFSHLSGPSPTLSLDMDDAHTCIARDFQTVKAEVFEEHREVFRRLAKQ
ncbi:MAG: DUF4926 domain-containing protein [Holophagaceae bacterium]|nr:DUF4926 domain-containing protein [Holophagaceae bacterium]